jgi:hypothetical protein
VREELVKASVLFRFCPGVGLLLGLALVYFIRAEDKPPSPPDKPAGGEIFYGPPGYGPGGPVEPLTPEERIGQLAWYNWTAGNQHFWRRLAYVTEGRIDLLRLLATTPRHERFRRLGVMNDPEYQAAGIADTENQYGLPLDVPKKQPTTPEEKARWEFEKKTYGEPTGVVGLRKFPNPRFTEEAKKKWNVMEFLKRPHEIEPPYIVGMACAICHVGFHPLVPPVNVEEPTWDNLSPIIGNQYLEEVRLFIGAMPQEDFRWHVANTQQPGTSETSRFATDFINNPNAINSVFQLGARARLKTPERISHAQAKIIKQMPPAVGSDLVETPEGPALKVPHVLKDGSDSMGVACASLRVYVNIGGMDHRQWMSCWATHPKNMLQAKQLPFDVQKARAHTDPCDKMVYWIETEQRMPAMEAFLTKMSSPLHLKDAPGVTAYLQADEPLVPRGMEVFLQHCARCHSNRQPDAVGHVSNVSPQHQRLEDFLKDNFLSDDKRYPITELGTNAARALAGNALREHIWEHFSSETYKEQPSPGRLWGLFNPLVEAAPLSFEVPAGGRGYYRTPSLVSMWATAPYLHNNSLGVFVKDPSVKGRLLAFQDGVDKLLSPEKRLGKRSIKLSSRDSFLFTPDPSKPLKDPDGEVVAFGEKVVTLGPQGPPIVVPMGTPVNLFANVHPRDLEKVKAAAEQGGFAAAMKVLLEVNQCPDFIEDRGHTYGAELSDADKRALIAFLKRL